MSKVLRLRQYGKGGYIGTRGKIHDAILNGKDWRSGNMWAENVHVGNGASTHYGQLDNKYKESVKRADYIIYSYSTPIAWHVGGGHWVVPDEKYSATTSRHQGIVRTALIFGTIINYNEDPGERRGEH